MKMEELHVEVMARAKQSGTDLTFDGSPEDKDNYEEQLEMVRYTINSVQDFFYQVVSSRTE